MRPFLTQRSHLAQSRKCHPIGGFPSACHRAYYRIVVALEHEDPGRGQHDEPWVLEEPRRTLLERIGQLIARAIARWFPGRRQNREERRWE